ncbi:hypothetical protein evm_002657 [Chilo suppressalis]|nr:hypothetical protein evm_002657 [Chilo suppressalis]
MLETSYHGGGVTKKCDLLPGFFDFEDDLEETNTTIPFFVLRTVAYGEQVLKCASHFESQQGRTVINTFSFENTVRRRDKREEPLLCSAGFKSVHNGLEHTPIG